jgi:hypothetical protein
MLETATVLPSGKYLDVMAGIRDLLCPVSVILRKPSTHAERRNCCICIFNYGHRLRLPRPLLGEQPLHPPP